MLKRAKKAKYLKIVAKNIKFGNILKKGRSLYAIIAYNKLLGSLRRP